MLMHACMQPQSAMRACKGTVGKKAGTVGSQFVASLAELIAKMQSCEVRTLTCIYMLLCGTY